MPAPARNSESPRRGALVAAALCAAVVGLAPATAQSQTLTDPDAAGDVVRFGKDERVVAVPERTLNDVSSTRLTHSASRVAIRVEYVDLKKGGDVQGLHIRLVTDEGVRRYLQLVAHPQHWSGETDMYNRRWHSVACGGVRHTIDYKANTMMVSFPRKCAGNPRWVKLRVVAYAQDRGFYADDALSDNPITAQDDTDLTTSRKVHRRASSRSEP
jgi:hypothetical protein